MVALPDACDGLYGHHRASSSRPSTKGGLQGTGEYELGKQFFHTDHLGNVAVVTDGDGKITSSTAYDSYGQMLTQGSSSFGRDNFPNKWAKAEHVRERGQDSGLSVMGARIYDRDARRFLSPDPLSVFIHRTGIQVIQFQTLTRQGKNRLQLLVLLYLQSLP